MILDRSCIYWSAKCKGKSVCLLYNTVGLRYSYIGLCFACAVAYLIVFGVSFLWMEAHPDYYEKYVLPTQPTESSSESETEGSQEEQLPALWR